MFSLAGKICVVTGPSQGLGRAIALAFGEQGTSDEAAWVSGAVLLVSGGRRDDE